ncbi:hypothetical protein DFH07DRAFT_745722 [Mycena maculata]|uniref:EF-hand domain-containing protein n=1 Tax=Mycena maculata TaxID=230809 RepID=A0AAD7N9B4_9AGAR|nr:hypothetical protein DFH07DRAFT_745722 [Mycena maculata]
MSKYPSHLSPDITPSKLKAQKSRARREPSGVFSLFQAPQVQQFKEAFQLIDHDKDGWVGERDLREVFASLGITPSPSTLAALLHARPGDTPASTSAADAERGVNFTMFLTMMSERLFEFDTEAELVEAFASFDEADAGFVRADEMRGWLSEVGERMGEREIDKLLKGPFTDRQGNFNYREWVKVLRVNEEEEPPAQ